MLRRVLQIGLVLALLLPQVAQAADDRFGLDWISPPAGVAGDARLAQAAALGVGWDRFPIYWNEVQPQPNGPFDFGKTDAMLAADQSRGIRVQAILLGAPGWAKPGDGPPDQDAWQRFVSTTVARYRGRISHWEMWNEPDLLDGDGKGRYWPWGVDEYARLLKTGYISAKRADPNATVLMAGLAMPYNNEAFFARLLESLARDPAAPANGWYFDVLPIHVYDRAARAYELPLGYLGFPSFSGFRALMKRRGFERPIWINELGVPVWDYGAGQKAPGRATQEEQSSFVVQSLAYGLAAGVERMMFFQLYDDGAGAVDPRSGQFAEYFGLVANDGRPRPAYQAFKSTIDLFSSARHASRLNTGRTIKNKNSKGVEAISLWGTGRGRITVVWNAEGGGPAAAMVPALTSSAQVLDKYGQPKGAITAQNGTYRLTLPAATNNNNFNCFTPRGCDPEDYVIGGEPVIIVENDSRVPLVSIDPLPSASAVPFQVSWRPRQPLPANSVYDVQYKDLSATPDPGGWRDWLTGTPRTSGAFGGETPLTLDHTYAFRVRARGPDSRPVQDWTEVPLASILVVGGGTWPPPTPEVDAKIQVVWPHANAPVSQASKANLSVNVFRRGTRTSVGPSWTSPPRLWRSIDNGVEEPVGVGAMRSVKSGDLTYPAWEFNDVDVSAARDPKRKVYFRLSMDGKREASNVWSHAVDARTYMPRPDVPTGVLEAVPAAVDAKIAIVWPHGNAPVDRASKANIVAYLFEHGGTRSVPLAFDGQVVLYRSLNNGTGEAVALADKDVKSENGVTFPTWTFNDVDVSAARDPRNKYYFRLEVGGVTAYSNVWAHAADARTFLPQPEVPTAVAP